MFKFEAKKLDSVSAEIKKMEPDAMTFALQSDAEAKRILDDIAARAWDMSSLSMQELNFAYHIADLCDAKKKRQLMAVFGERVNELMFDIGWLYCQMRPNNANAAELFEIACMWMSSKDPDKYAEHILGILNTDWKKIYSAMIAQMKKESLSLIEFVHKYGIMEESLFFKQLQCSVLAESQPDELAKLTELLKVLISSYDIPAEYIKPLVEGYISGVSEKKLPKDMLKVMMDRVSADGRDDSIGVPHSVILAWRKSKFAASIDEIIDYDEAKHDMYKNLMDRIRDIKKYADEQIVTIDFGFYQVVDSPNWGATAYAYSYRVYPKIMGEWEKGGRRPEFWPGVPEDQVVSARDVQLGIKPGKVIALNFGGFDGLYTEELISNGR